MAATATSLRPRDWPRDSKVRFLAVLAAKRVCEIAGRDERMVACEYHMVNFRLFEEFAPVIDCGFLVNVHIGSN